MLLAALAVVVLGPPTPGQVPPTVRYHLRAVVEDSTGWIRGTAEVRYQHPGSLPLQSLTLALPYNAYRPGSRTWPEAASPRGDHSGLIRVTDLRLDGTPASLAWPAAPDSSSATILLARPLATGDSVLINFSWEARPPSLPWRRDRRGRRLVLSGWYPRVMDETAGTSVLSPAFATLLLELTLAGDQVLGGTGVPLCGDPGWAGAAAFPTTRLTLQRGWYREPQAGSVTCEGAAAGMKRVVWYAEGVAEATYAMSPTYRYEEGDFDGRPVHTLYERDGERLWGAGLATRRIETALAWVFEMSGPYPWPQITVAQGIDGAGVAQPMTLVTDRAGQAELLGLLGLMTTQEVMTGGAPVFTVGTAAYQAAWYFESLGRRSDYLRIERQILDWDLDGLGSRDEPLGEGSSISPCGTTFCRRAEFMLYQLRRWAGNDEAMRQVFRTLVSRFSLRPTEPGAFQRTASELIRPDPAPLYSQLARGGILYDDAITSARRERIAEGGWRTVAVIERRGRGRFPQILWVVADSDTAVARASALAPRETLTVITRSRPKRVVLDPLAQSHDWNMLNNRRGFGFQPGWNPLRPLRSRDLYLDAYFARHTARDRLTMGWTPTASYSDPGGWAYGVRLREDYLGRFDLNELGVWFSTGWATHPDNRRMHGRLMVRNPTPLRATGWSQGFDLAWAEGRAMAGADFTRRFRTRVADSTWRSLGIALHWWSVTDPTWTDRRFYDDAATTELTVTGRLARPTGRWPIRLDASAAAGLAADRAGSATRSGYGRLTMAGSVRKTLGQGFSLGLRVYAGAVLSSDSVLRQRRIYLAGADPYERFGSPLLRSRGSLLAGSDMFYHAPGGAGVRGLDPRLSGDRVLGATLEVEQAVGRRGITGTFGELRVAVFGDGALASGDLEPGRDRLAPVGDAGVGLRMDHHIGSSRFTSRVDLPLWVSRPRLAQDAGPRSPLGFRWSVSFAPPF